jgi:hypothetical protein
MTTLTHYRHIAGLLAALLLALGLAAAPAPLATDSHVVAQTHALRA